MRITEAQFDVLHHALSARTGRQYRNHYCCGPGHSGYPTCRELVELGLMVERRSDMLHEGDVFFHATPEGVDAWKDGMQRLRAGTPLGETQRALCDAFAITGRMVNRRRPSHRELTMRVRELLDENKRLRDRLDGGGGA